jgi:hypothetical protein
VQEIIYLYMFVFFIIVHCKMHVDQWNLMVLMMVCVMCFRYFLGWYCAVSMQVFSFTVLLIEFFSCSGVSQF